MTGGKNASEILKLLGYGKDFGLQHSNDTSQEGEGGIAATLALAEHFVDGERVCLGARRRHHRAQLPGVGRSIRACKGRGTHPLGGGARPRRFGVAAFRGTRIIGVEGKTPRPKSR